MAPTATTLYLDPKLAKAAKVKAAVMGKSFSDLANEGLARLLKEDEAIIRLANSRRRGTRRCRATPRRTAGMAAGTSGMMRNGRWVGSGGGVGTEVKAACGPPLFECSGFPPPRE